MSTFVSDKHFYVGTDFYMQVRFERGTCLRDFLTSLVKDNLYEGESGFIKCRSVIGTGGANSWKLIATYSDAGVQYAPDVKQYVANHNIPIRKAYWTPSSGGVGYEANWYIEI